MANYVIYTDGGAHNEDGDMKGIGAWAFLFPDDESDEIAIYAGKVIDTTNNRTAMMAIINAISFCESGSDVNIISDSGYVVKGYTHPAYLDRWMSNGWRTSNNKEVSNIDLWQKIIALSYHYNIKFTHIRGHNKDRNLTHAYWNSIVDKACTAVMNSIDGEYEGMIKLMYNKEDKTMRIIPEVIYNE